MNQKSNLYMGLALLIAMFMITACGKKGPPLPPVKTGKVLASPENIKYELKDDQVTLTWTHSVDPKSAVLSPKSFEVFVAVKGQDDCEGCPFVFKSAGKVAMPEMKFYYRIDRDIRYYFRIQAVGDDDIRSEYSATVLVEIK